MTVEQLIKMDINWKSISLYLWLRERTTRVIRSREVKDLMNCILDNKEYARIIKPLVENKLITWDKSTTARFTFNYTI